MARNPPIVPDNPDELSPYEQREQLVQAGHVRGLLEVIQQTRAAFLNLKEAFGQVQRAIDVASRGDPYAFTQLLFQVMTSFAAYVRMRLQYLCTSELAR